MADTPYIWVLAGFDILFSWSAGECHWWIRQRVGGLELNEYRSLRYSLQDGFELSARSSCWLTSFCHWNYAVDFPWILLLLKLLRLSFEIWFSYGWQELESHFFSSYRCKCWCLWYCLELWLECLGEKDLLESGEGCCWCTFCSFFACWMIHA